MFLPLQMPLSRPFDKGRLWKQPTKDILQSHLVQPHTQTRFNRQNRLLRLLSILVWETSRAGNNTIPWGNWLQPLVKLNYVFLLSTWNLLWHNLRPLSLVLQPCTSVKSLALSSQQLPCTSWKTTGRYPSLFQAVQAWLPQLFLKGNMLQPPTILRALHGHAEVY